MKKGIHPEYVKCQVTCVSSGKTFEVMSTKEQMKVDISSYSHPFYTGEQKIVDTTGRVEKFNKKYNIS